MAIPEYERGHQYRGGAVARCLRDRLGFKTSNNYFDSDTAEHNWDRQEARGGLLRHYIICRRADSVRPSHDVKEKGVSAYEDGRAAQSSQCDQHDGDLAFAGSCPAEAPD